LNNPNQRGDEMSKELHEAVSIAQSRIDAVWKSHGRLERRIKKLEKTINNITMKMGVTNE